MSAQETVALSVRGFVVGLIWATVRVAAVYALCAGVIR